MSSEIGNFKRFHGDGEGISEHQTDVEPFESGTTELILHNPLILDAIFDHLPKEDWKSARLVNSTWYSGLQPRWRDQMNYRLELGGCSRYGTPEIGTVTPRFLKQQHPANNPSDPLKLGDHPIRNIKVRCDNDQFLQRSGPGQIQFWNLFGHGLKSLQLIDVRIPKGALLKRLLFELTPSLEEFRYEDCVCADVNLELNIGVEYLPPATLQKNLKVVVVDLATSISSEARNSEDYEQEYGAYKPRFPISWIEFFSVFPNIQKLVVDVDIDPDETEKPSDHLKLFEAVDVIRKANNNEVLNITELRTGHAGFAHFNAIEIESLLATLPISILHMYVYTQRNEKTVLVLQTLKSTLRQLTLILDEEVDSENEHLPRNVFPQGLTKLSLHGPLVSSFEFLFYLPNLVELNVQDIPCILPPEVDMASITPRVNLKKLRYSMFYSFPVPHLHKQMEVVTKLMPNVKRCDCTVDAEEFRAICQGLVNLEHLDVWLKFNSENFFVDNLVKLKYLRSLKVAGLGTIKITDKSVFRGFLRIPSLDKITLSTSVQQITDEGLEAMGGKLCYD